MFGMLRIWKRRKVGLINLGEIVNGNYYKIVVWNKAVLWKDKEISLHRQVVEEWFAKNDIDKVIFHDRVKRTQWSAPLEKIRKVWHLKKVGQEEQYYFPIEVLTKEELEK